jgi:hypothetical protein
VETHLLYPQPGFVSQTEAVRIHVRIDCHLLYWMKKKQLTRHLFSSQLTEYMGNLASYSRRFFHPAAIDEMLSTFIPLFNGTSLDVRFSLSG